MAVTQVYNPQDGLQSQFRSEWLIEQSSDLASITNVAIGQIAYTADFAFIAQWDGSNWATIVNDAQSSASTSSP